MTIKFYIGKGSNTAYSEFDKSYERTSAIEVAKTLQRHYARVENKHVAVLFNLAHPPADMVVITSSGMGVVDFKEYHGQIQGSCDDKTTWKVGETQMQSGRHINPFMQIRSYRNTLRSTLINDRKLSLSIFSRNPDFYISASLLFTSPAAKFNRVEIPSKDNVWFKILSLSGIESWVESLAFGASLRINDANQINDIATKIFETIEWKDLEPHLPAGNVVEPYGTLWFAIDGKQIQPYSLVTDIVTIGRDPSNSITTSAELVSREHLKLIRDRKTYVIEDLDSRNGTWLNGKKLNPNEKHHLKTGDTILLGSDNKQELSNNKSVEYIFHAIAQPIKSTKLYSSGNEEVNSSER